MRLASDTAGSCGSASWPLRAKTNDGSPTRRFRNQIPNRIREQDDVFIIGEFNCDVAELIFIKKIWWDYPMAQPKCLPVFQSNFFFFKTSKNLLARMKILSKLKNELNLPVALKIETIKSNKNKKISLLFCNNLIDLDPPSYKKKLLILTKCNRINMLKADAWDNEELSTK